MPLVYDINGFETIVTGAAAVPFTVVAGRNYAFITVEGTPVRFRIDGVAPTAAVGHLLAIGDVLTLEGGTAIIQFQVIATAGAGTISVSYGYREQGMP